MLKLIQGSFLAGCGVIVQNVDTNGLYHLLVHKENDNRLFVEIGKQKFYEVDICRQ